jgi:hypothetical protein
MGVTMDQRGKIVDAVDEFVAVDVPDPAALAACGIDRIGLHEHGGAGIAAGQTRQRAIVQFLGMRLRIRIHLASPPGRYARSSELQYNSALYFNGLFGRNSWIYGVIPRYVQFACRAARNGRKAGSPNAPAIKKRHDSGPFYA